MTLDHQYLNEALDSRLKRKMLELASSQNLVRATTPGIVDKRLYAIYLIQTYHYTRHNTRHQALIATRDGVSIQYMKYALKHALEEAGHEMMAIHDLQNIGVEIQSKKNDLGLPGPMSSTTRLNNYLYKISKEENPLARLGYSYWAERVYDYITPFFKILSSLGISKKQMTFLGEHAEIDNVHAIEVAEAILRFAKTPEDWEAIAETMLTSLELTAAMMDEIFEEFMRLKEGRKSEYQFLNGILTQ